MPGKPGSGAAKGATPAGRGGWRPAQGAGASLAVLLLMGWAPASASAAGPSPGTWPTADVPTTRRAEPSLPSCGAYAPRVLQEVTEQVRQGAAGTSQLPVVVFDLDGTLLDPAGRTRQILIAALKSRGAPPHEAALEALLAAPAGGTEPYSPEELLTRLGVQAGPLRDHLLEAWRAHFLSEDFLAHDAALAGAQAHVQALWEAGAIIVYLSARPVRMAAGTVASLRRAGFPVAVARTTLVLKEEGSASDTTAWKVAQAPWLRRLGRIVAIYENEPANLNALRAALSPGTAVFVDSRYSAAAPLAAGTWCVADYSLR